MEKGQKAPEILGIDQNGNEIKLSDYSGRGLILYFYPKDSTSGCTAEACSIRDNYSELQKRGYDVVGVSVDSETSHLKFISKNALPFPLIADTSHRLVTEMGVWGEKSMYGRKYMGTFRTTFIISPDGTIKEIFQPKQIKTKEHGTQLLDAIDAMS